MDSGSEGMNFQNEKNHEKNLRKEKIIVFKYATAEDNVLRIVMLISKLIIDAIEIIFGIF